MLINNLIYINIIDNYLGYLDTGGGITFLFRNPELFNKIFNKISNKNLIIKYMEEPQLDFLSKKVILFIGNDYWANKIYMFNYLDKIFKFINKIPNNLSAYKLFNKKENFAICTVLFENKKEKFLFDTGACLTRNKRNYGISFLDGIIFDKLKDKYKVIEQYDDDQSPCIIIPQIVIFGSQISNVKFLRRDPNAFFGYMSGLTGITHIGAIGGNVLKHFNIYCDFKNKQFFV